MKRAAFLAAILLLLSITSRDVVRAQTAVQRKGMVTLAGLRDNARPLLIFASKPDDPQLEIQLRTLNEHAPEAAERDITVIALPYNNPSPTAAIMSSSEAEAARRRFKVAPADFAVVLIGKDGGEKLRSTHPVPFSRLRDTIDSMPMRQEEMRRQASGQRR